MKDLTIKFQYCIKKSLKQIYRTEIKTEIKQKKHSKISKAILHISITYKVEKKRQIEFLIYKAIQQTTYKMSKVENKRKNP